MTGLCRSVCLHPSARTAGLIVALTTLFDQLTKWALMQSLTPGQSVPLIPSILHLTYVQNTGAAFGIFKGMTSAFIFVSVAAAVWIVYELSRQVRSHRVAQSLLHGSRALSLWGLSLVLGGAVGNLIDRVRDGHVIDFIDIRIWPVFNIADSAITIGVGLLLLPILTAKRRPSKHTHDATRRGARP